jgi:uncharacterized C2H2 Zn-finger protein
MPLVQAWQCPKTGRLFADRERYVAHLRKTARRRFLARTKDKRKAALLAQFEVLRRCSSLRDIETTLVDLSPAIEAYLQEFDRYLVRDKRTITFRLTSVSFSGGLWKECLSNIHSAPRGKSRNWRGDKNLPVGYPGMSGRIRIAFIGNTGMPTDFFSDVLAINLGSGGGIGPDDSEQRHSYDYTLWDEDWPSLTMMRALTA